MREEVSLHPIYRYGAVLIALACAVGMLLVSGYLNPHLTAWVLALYGSCVLMLAALRQARTNIVHRSYAVYLFALIFYLLALYCLHALRPWGNPASPARIAEAKPYVAAWMFVFVLGGNTTAVAHFHFMLRFAEVRARWLYWVEVVGWLGTLVFNGIHLAGFFIEDYIWVAPSWYPNFGGTYPYFFWFTSVFLTLVILVPLVKVFTTKDGQTRLQMLFYVIGAGPMLLTFWANFLTSMGIEVYPAGGMAFLMHAVILGYAVFWKRVFDVRVVLRRGLAYAGVSMVLGMAYGLILWLLSIISATEPQPGSILSGMMFVFLAGFIFSPALGYLQRLLDRLFFREDADKRVMLERFAQDMASTINLERVVASTCELFSRTFASRRVSVYLADEQRRLSRFGTWEHAFKASRWPSEEWLPDRVSTGLDGSRSARRVRSPETEPGVDAVRLTEGDEALAVPVFHREEPLAVVVLEPRKADEPYTERDVRFAETVAAQVSVALLNARSFERLERLQELTTRTLEGLSVGVLVANRSGRITLMNDAAQRYFGETTGKPSDRGVSDLPPPLGARLQKALGDALPLDNVEISTEGDPPRHVLLSTRPLEHAQEEPLTVLLLYDITEHKELEALAQKQERLAQVGEMISAINHEVKNLLQPIQAQVAKLSRGRLDDAAFSRSMEIVTDRLAAMNRMLLNLRDLARPIELRIRSLKLKGFLDSILMDIKELPGASDVRFVIDISPDAQECHADGQWLRQVVYNLIKNAVEALESVDDPEVLVRTRNGKDAVSVEVHDNGCGMDDVSLGKLFRPFFSTKAGAGTGLGLSISQKVIGLHGGGIDLESKVGEGTRFTVRLPVRTHVP